MEYLLAISTDATSVILEIFELVASASMEETRGPVEKNFTNAQIEAVKKIRSARDNYERLGLLPGLKTLYGFCI